MNYRKELTCAILAGGESSRMGYDKGLSEVKGTRSIELILSVLQQLATNIMIVANNSSYDYLGIPVFPDRLGKNGPLGGIHTVLKEMATDHSFIVACDMPFISVDFIEYLLSFRKQHQVIVPRFKGQVHPICGYYSKSCMPILEKLISNKLVKTLEALNSLDTKILSIKGNEPCFRENMFININSKKELEQIHAN